MHKEWCGNKCADCVRPCVLDTLIPCSPDCECLGENGERNHKECETCDANVTKKRLGEERHDKGF